MKTTASSSLAAYVLLHLANHLIALSLIAVTFGAFDLHAQTAPFRSTSGGKLEVVWIKKEFDGVKLAFDLGPAGNQTDIDLRPHYTMNWLPAAGQIAVIKARPATSTKARNSATGASGTPGPSPGPDLPRSPSASFPSPASPPLPLP